MISPTLKLLNQTEVLGDFNFNGIDSQQLSTVEVCSQLLSIDKISTKNMPFTQILVLEQLKYHNKEPKLVERKI